MINETVLKKATAIPDEPCYCPYCLSVLLTEEQTDGWDDERSGANKVFSTKKIPCPHCKKETEVTLKQNILILKLSKRFKAQLRNDPAFFAIDVDKEKAIGVLLKNLEDFGLSSDPEHYTIVEN